MQGAIVASSQTAMRPKLMGMAENNLVCDRAVGLVSVEIQLPAIDLGESAVSPSTSTIRRRLRNSLGLTHGFLCGTGHQPVFWHSGILAKFIVASTVASAGTPGGRWVHFLSDQDDVDPFRIDLPVRDRAGSVRRSSIRIAAAQPRFARDALPCSRTAMHLRRPEGVTIASPTASSALDRVIAAASTSTSQTSAALQIAHTNQTCATRWVDAPCAIIESGSLLKSDAGGEILERIFTNPQECAIAFNATLRVDPHAARPLRENGDRSEVPLWGIRDDGSRERLNAVEASRRWKEGRPLLPRAFLASGLMRLICDTFVHGVGGVRYERVGQRWWSDFLKIELPPFALATATVLPDPHDLGLDFDARSLPEISWREAWWDPTRLDSRERPPSQIEPRRAALLQRIADAPRKSSDRRSAYRDLCGHIESLRDSHRAELSSLESVEAQVRSIRAQIDLAEDRTWPFVLMRTEAIDALARTIRDRIKIEMAGGTKPGNKSS